MDFYLGKRLQGTQRNEIVHKQVDVEHARTVHRDSLWTEYRVPGTAVFRRQLVHSIIYVQSRSDNILYRK